MDEGRDKKRKTQVLSESGRSCVFASLGDNGSEKSERKQMEKNKAEISRKSLKSEEKRRASQMADTEAVLEFNKIKEISGSDRAG